MSDTAPVIGVLVPGTGGDHGWVDGGWEAASLLERAGFTVDVRVGELAHDPSLVRAWDFAVLHGIQYADLALALVADGLGVVISDVDPALVGSTPEGLTMVNWHWDLGAEAAGRSAAAQTEGPLGFVAGPIVPTQRRAAAAFVAGVAAVDDTRRVNVVHVSDFRGVDEGAAAGATLVDHFGCTLVAHSADEAGSAAVEAARERGALTYGFLTPVGKDAASIRSSLGQVLAKLAQDGVAQRPRPGVYECTLDSSEIRVERP